MTDTLTEVREGVIERIVKLGEARKALHDSIGGIEFAGAIVHDVWDSWPVPYANKGKEYDSLCTFAEMVAGNLNADLMAAAQQAAKLIARDVIAPVARESKTPVAELTGNSYMPPIRSLSDVETIYQADENGDVWEIFYEALEHALDEEGIKMGCPDYDNALYVVDTRRWAISTGVQQNDSDPNQWLDNSIYSRLAH